MLVQIKLRQDIYFSSRLSKPGKMRIFPQQFTGNLPCTCVQAVNDRSRQCGMQKIAYMAIQCSNKLERHQNIIWITEWAVDRNQNY